MRSDMVRLVQPLGTVARQSRLTLATGALSVTCSKHFIATWLELVRKDLCMSIRSPLRASSNQDQR